MSYFITSILRQVNEVNVLLLAWNQLKLLILSPYLARAEQLQTDGMM
jgi:hypothetical protein